MNPKRLLVMTHRWFGVGMCLLFALWFASGIIMMYVEYPELTEVERLDKLPPLDVSEVSLTAEEALIRSGIEEGAVAIRLTSVAGRPAYLIRNSAGHLATLFADTGEKLTEVTAQQALRTVRASGFYSVSAGLHHDGKTEMDQWTVSSSLHEHRPLHRVAIDDDAGTVVYVSDLTGQIVRDTQRTERLWNWLGSTIHWIYPMQLRRNEALWSDVVIVLSLAGILSVITGGIIGVMHLRGNSRRGLSPYRGMDKWHHLLGLASLIFLSTFIFSGLMSMGPWGIFESKVSVREQIERYTGGPIKNIGKFPDIPWQSLPGNTREITWRQIVGQGYLVLSLPADQRRVILNDAQGENSPSLQERIEKALPAFIPDADVTGVEILTSYDNYYYSRHNRFRPLPVYHVKFNDPESTWFYVDADSGAVISRHTDASRLGRWLFNGLHSLDFSFLIANRPLWDIILILLSIVGFVFSVTAVVIGWRRVTRRRSTG